MDHHERQAFWQQQVKQHHSSGLDTSLLESVPR